MSQRKVEYVHKRESGEVAVQDDDGDDDDDDVCVRILLHVRDKQWLVCACVYRMCTTCEL